MNIDLREGQFVMFKNGYKTSDKQPDFKGQIMINGRIMDICSYVRQGPKEKFFSGMIQEPFVKDKKVVDEMLEPAPIVKREEVVQSPEELFKGDVTPDITTHYPQIDTAQGEPNDDGLPF